MTERRRKMREKATFTPNGGTAGTSNDSPSLRKKL